jgi:predicted metalloprotease with PDZ domain
MPALLARPKHGVLLRQAETFLAIQLIPDGRRYHVNAFVKSLLLAVCLAGWATLSSAEAAEGRAELRLYPGPGGPEAPRLGIYGHMEWGLGMVVDSVVWGTPAWRIGLEPGDVIRAINGRWIRSEFDYFQGLRYSGGFARIVVQDVRTGALVSRTAFLGGEYSSGGTVAGLEITPRVRLVP